MAVPDANTIGTWATVVATFIILVMQRLNAMQGKARGEKMQKTVETTGDTVTTATKKISDIHNSTVNGQVEILKTRALALRTVATLRGLPNDFILAEQAERDLTTYLKLKGDINEASKIPSVLGSKPMWSTD